MELQRSDLGDRVSGDSGLVSMPLIIPPVRQKQYDDFGDLYPNLRHEAEGALVRAQSITLIDYSFPVTDVISQSLLRSAFSKRTASPVIRIKNPDPELIGFSVRGRLRSTR